MTVTKPGEVWKDVAVVHPLRWSPGQKQKSPLNLSVQRGLKRGMGVRHSLFPVPTLGARPRGGCRLPDAILHGKRSFRPHSRAVERLAAIRFSSEASWPAWTGGCATGLPTWPRHDDDFSFASWPLCAGSATAFGRAFAPCYGSDLLTLRLHFAHHPAVRFSASPALRKVFTWPA